MPPWGKLGKTVSLVLAALSLISRYRLSYTAFFRYSQCGLTPSSLWILQQRRKGDWQELPYQPEALARAAASLANASGWYVSVCRPA